MTHVPRKRDSFSHFMIFSAMRGKMMTRRVKMKLKVMKSTRLRTKTMMPRMRSQCALYGGGTR